MSECIEHEESTNEHDDFEEELDYFSHDDETTFPVPRVVRRPPVSRDSIMSDITGTAELEQQRGDAVPKDEQPRIGINPVSRVLDRSYFQGSASREAVLTHRGFKTQDQETSNKVHDERFERAAVPVRTSIGQEDHDVIDMYRQSQNDRGRRDIPTSKDTSHNSPARHISMRERENERQACGRTEENDIHEFASSNSHTTRISNIETSGESSGSNEVILANAYWVDTTPLVTATPIPSFEASSSEQSHGGSKPRKTRVIKTTIIKKAEETKRDNGGSVGTHSRAEAKQAAVRKTTTFCADGSCVVKTFNADGTTTTTIKHPAKGKGKKASSKSTNGLSVSTIDDWSATSSAQSSGVNSKRGDARSQASSSGSQSASSSRKSASSSDKRIVKSRTTKESADGSRIETTHYTDGTKVTKTFKASKRRS